MVKICKVPVFKFRAAGRKNQRSLTLGVEIFFPAAIIFTLLLFENDFNYSQLLHAVRGAKKAFIHSSESVTHSALTLIHLLFSNLPLTTNQGLNFFANSVPQELITLPCSKLNLSIDIDHKKQN